MIQTGHLRDMLTSPLDICAQSVTLITVHALCPLIS